jgi:hypothetical protein
MDKELKKYVTFVPRKKHLFLDIFSTTIRIAQQNAAFR